MTIKKIAKTLTLITLLVSGNNTIACAATNGTNEFNWEPLMNAITQVESEGNAKAVSGNSVGAMQITPILVKECNEILQQRGDKKRYTMKDRYNVQKSREMFRLIMSKYNPGNNIERAIRIWNGGPRFSTKHTQKYYAKVMKEYSGNNAK